MIFGLKCRFVDISFVTALLLLAAVPLILLRGSSLLDRTDCLVFLLVLISSLVVWWVFLTRPTPVDTTLAETTSPVNQEVNGKLPWWQTIAIAGLLAAVAAVAIIVPLKIQFWGGTDDFISFPDRSLQSLLKDWDGALNRPLTVVPTFVGQLLAPNRVEGYLCLGIFLWWLNGLLLYGILRVLLPQARWLPVVAALLLIIDCSDPSRFYILWIGNVYWMILALLLGSLWLFLWSYRRGSRLLLFLSCLLLIGTLLTNEVSYPLAVLGPLFLWPLKKHRPQLLLWIYAWVGSIALVAGRLLLFLANIGGAAYQTRQTTEAFQKPRFLWKNFRTHLEAGLSNFQTTGAVLNHWKVGAVLLLLVGVLVCLAAWRRAAQTSGTRRWQYLGVLVMALLTVVLGAVPFLHIPEVFRTQILTAPGQAVVLACILCPIAGLLGRRFGTALVAVALGFLAANTTAEAVVRQQKLRATSPINYERTVHIFRQIRAIYPNPTPGSLILLYLDEPMFAPFVTNYCCLHLSRQVLGTPMVQVNYAEPGGILPQFHADSVSVLQGERFFCAGERNYDKVLAFRLALDGTVTLMRQLPQKLLPPNHTAHRYDPLTQHRPGPVEEIPFLHFPFWAPRPADLFDMFDGVILGQGWSPLQVWQGKPSRQGSDGAELIVNPLGQQQRQLRFRMEDTSGRLEARDLDDKVVAATELNGSREAVLTVPTDAERLTLIRLRVTKDKNTSGVFRVFCPETALADFQKPPPQPTDIATGDLALGRNWHPLERFRGQSFRWVANDAEIVLEALPSTPRALLVELEPGFGMRGQPCHLTVQDKTGETVATACVRARETLRLHLPTNTPAGTVLRLHVEGGGQLLPNDRRILNFRVFHCAWETP